MLKSVIPSAAAAALACSAAPLHGQTIVSSFPDWDGSHRLSFIGRHMVVGQTFTLPAGPDTTLASVRTMMDIAPPASGNIRFYIYALAGNQLSGPALFRSDPLVDPGAPDFTFTPVEYTGLNLQLTAGQTYALLFSNMEGAPNAMANTSFAATPSLAAASPYLGSIVGNGFFTPQPLSETVVVVTAGVAPRDFVLELTFVPAPMPAAALGLGAMALLRPRRR
ncbi:MAG TPA: choice-of-anchor R domain-containing protein [Phycisphaerales bacterium]|nr:choice-of-anchor R domain-containing protein [Phycisphaerales bacterium]